MASDAPIRERRQGAVLCVTIDNPPVNALDAAVRAGLVDVFERAEAEVALQAIVLCVGGTRFNGCADIREYRHPPKTPLLPDLCNRIEKSQLLVIASLHGACLGGGLEIALSADYRIAHPKAEVGFPEVNFGLIPCAGGTQRLPRLAGAAVALDLISSGRRVLATEALSYGILDEIQAGAPEEAGVAYAQALLDQRACGRSLRDSPSPEPVDWDAAQADIARRARGQIAPVQALRAVRASVEMPFEMGLGEERRIFSELRHSDQCEAMMHVFLAERAAARLPELKGIPSPTITSVGVVGGGTMGAGIASAALMAGLPVTIVESSEAAAKTARDRIAQMLEGATRRGKMTPAACEAALGPQLTLSSEYEALAKVDLVIEAVFEDMAVKKAVFTQLDAQCKADAILATNTSYLNINEIADVTGRPQSVIGLHFFAPAHVMKLLEIVAPDRASLPVVAAGFAFARRLGKRAVRAGVGDGFIGNRILGAYRLVADQIVLEGAEPQDVDNAMEQFGFPKGPYAVADLSGLDIGRANRKRLARARARGDEARSAVFPDRLCEAGHLGRKSGSGYYFYAPDDQAGEQNPLVLELIEEERKSRGIEPQEFSPDQISARIMAAIANEAASVIDDGIARRPLDVDVAMVAGYGFPRHRGGPCKWADLKGLGALCAEIEGFAEADPHFWRPAPLLVRLANEGRLFDALNN